MEGDLQPGSACQGAWMQRVNDVGVAGVLCGC